MYKLYFDLFLVYINLYVCTVVRSEVQSDQEVPDMDENGLLLGIDMFMSSQLNQQQPPFSGMYLFLTVSRMTNENPPPWNEVKR